MLEDEPIQTGLECPQCGVYSDPPPGGVHGEIRCPHCRAIILFATSDDARPALTSRHTVAVPDDLLTPDDLSRSKLPPGQSSPAAAEHAADDESDEFRVSAAEAPKPQTWFLPPPLPEQDEPVEPEAAPVVHEPLGKTFFSPDVFLYAWRFPAIKQWIWLAAFAFLTLELVLTVVTEFSYDPGTRWGSGFFYIFPAVAVLVYTLAYAGAYLAAITERTAYNTDTNSDWPEGDWRQRFIDGVRVAYLLTQAAMFGGMLGGIVSLVAPNAFWPVCSVGIFFLFPVLFLSALETNSATVPLSLPVWRSLRLCWPAWACFYAASAGVWLAVAAVAVWVPRVDLIWPVVVGPFAAMAVFAYGRLLGRLAGYLTRHVGFLVADPEID